MPSPADSQRGSQRARLPKSVRRRAQCGLMVATSPLQWSGVWRDGPDAGATVALPVGRHLVGRAHTAGFRCDDPALLPHHALIEVADDGAVTLTQLAGRTPLRVDGRASDEPIELTNGSAIEIGASTFVLVDDVHGTQLAHLRDGAVVRAPRLVPHWQPAELNGPGRPPLREASNGGLLPAALGLAGAGTIAMLLQQPMFLVFGALGAMVAIGSWVAQRVAATRKLRAATSEFDRASDGYQQQLTQQHTDLRRHTLATVGTIDRSVRTMVERDVSLWTRRAHHPDAYFVAIGMNVAEIDVPAAADLGPSSRIALLGPHAIAVARSLVLQLAAACGPADLRIVIATDHPECWASVRALPHIFDEDNDGAHTVHRLFITDQPALLATRTSPLRRAIGDERRDALIVVLSDADASVPHVCRSVLTTSAGPSARWVADVQRTMLPQQVRLVGVGERTTARCAASLRGLIDPEDPLSVASVVPRELALTDLLQRDGRPITPAVVAAAWATAGPDPAPRTPIGVAADGVVDIDLVRDGPHGLIAGTTGSGKSELLRSLIVGMAAAVSPEHLTFVLVDYKGGATFDACAALPHVVGIVTDLDDQLADRALRSLHAELRRREALLREHGAADLGELRARLTSASLPRLVVVIDEFAALVAEQPTFLHALVGIAQRGRSLGVHLLLATQRPSGVITDDIRANTNLRLALRLQDTADAIDVVGIAAPAQLPRGVPGRAVLRLGAEDHLTFQTAHCADAKLVRIICEAARLAGLAPADAPWMPPLPETFLAAHMDIQHQRHNSHIYIPEPSRRRVAGRRTHSHRRSPKQRRSPVDRAMEIHHRHHPARRRFLQPRQWSHRIRPQPLPLH